MKKMKTLYIMAHTMDRVKEQVIYTESHSCRVQFYGTQLTATETRNQHASVITSAGKCNTGRL